MKKIRILIFGAGSMGARFYRLNRWRYQVVGFLDNDPEKAGTRLFNKPVYAAQKLSDIHYDKIVITSDYQSEIYSQLLNDLGVNEDKIESYVFKPVSSLEKQFNRLSDLKFRVLLNTPAFLLPLINQLFFRQSGLSLKPLVWLDELDSKKVSVLREAQQGVTVGPNFIGKGAKIKDVTIPEVALYHLKNTQVGSVGRSFILNNGYIAVERVTTAITDRADYSARHLVMHNHRNGLVRETQSQKIEKGILINGVSETNYYHWMIEILSQLQYVNELQEVYKDFPLLIPAWVNKIQSVRDFFVNFDINRPLIFLDNLNAYQVENLLIISTPNFHVPHLSGLPREQVENSYLRPESIDFLKGIGLNARAYKTSREHLPRLFLARKHGKRNYNQDEVYSLLKNYDFKQVFLEDLSFVDQVDLFQNADIIVGPPGAAWSNLLFCKKGSKALSWVAEEIGDSSCFSNIANYLDVRLDYIAFYSGREDSKDLYMADYNINQQDIRSWIERECDTR